MGAGRVGHNSGSWEQIVERRGSLTHSHQLPGWGARAAARTCGHSCGTRGGRSWPRCGRSPVTISLQGRVAEAGGGLDGALHGGRAV